MHAVSISPLWVDIAATINTDGVGWGGAFYVRFSVQLYVVHFTSPDVIVTSFVLFLGIHTRLFEKLVESTTRSLAFSMKSIKKRLGNVMCVCVCVCCLLYTSPSPRDQLSSRMPSSA